MTGLTEFRTAEFESVRNFFGHGVSVLEIGGGVGYQASLVALTGSRVVSVDIESPSNSELTYYDVQIYDGKNLPFPDGTFDVVFSSNVLEHVQELEVMNSEIYRVLKQDGKAIHILPTSAWRLYTSLAHYIHFFVRLTEMLFFKRRLEVRLKKKATTVRNDNRSIKLLLRVLADGPHGEYPSAISELWYFSKVRWLRVFQGHQFDCIDNFSSNIIYTGYTVMPFLALSTRRVLSKFFGSSTRVYILRKSFHPLG